MKAVLATVAALVFTGLASANVTITGTGKVVYVPDLAKVFVGVSSDGTTAAEAWQKNAALVKKMIDALKALGIDPKDIKTVDLGVTPKYDTPKEKAPILVGYTVTYNLQVTVRKLDEVGTVLDRLVENGANRNVGISFGCSDMDKLMDQARLKAITEARKRAELYVTGAGASLGQVLSINEGNFNPWPMQRFELAKGSAADSLPILSGEQELTVSVTVTYAIVPKLAS
jgi:uncharacterized protein YggE